MNECAVMIGENWVTIHIILPSLESEIMFILFYRTKTVYSKMASRRAKTGAKGKHAIKH